MNMKEIYGKAVTATDSLGYVVIHTMGRMECSDGRNTYFLKDDVKKVDENGEPNIKIFTSDISAARVFGDYSTARDEAARINGVMMKSGKVKKALIASIRVRRLMLALPPIHEVDVYEMTRADMEDELEECE